ncbi:MAG: FAD binding domain-containing protein [Pseudomonadota bacterium]
MRLPAFSYEQPQDLDQALELLTTHGSNCRILAGGTDLLVRMKQGLVQPSHLISLKALKGLTAIEESVDQIRIGAAVPLADILTYGPIRDGIQGLHEAVHSVGAPSIQHFSGTIGGNLCQENRCRYFNQSKFFRKARQACIKAGGKTCFAWEGGSDRCHSVCRSDVAPPLVAMNSLAVVRSKKGERVIPLAEMYSFLGEHPLALADDEILTEILVPKAVPGSGTAFEKLAYRSAIDYAVVSSGAFVQTSGDRIVKARLVIGAVSRGPLTISEAEKVLENKPVNDLQALDDAGTAAMNAAQPFIANNMDEPADYRIRMVSVTAKRALARALKRAVNGASWMEAQ